MSLSEHEDSKENFESSSDSKDEKIESASDLFINVLFPAFFVFVNFVNKNKNVW